MNALLKRKWIDAHLLSALPLLKIMKPINIIRLPISYDVTKWDGSLKTIDRQGNSATHEYIIEQFKHTYLNVVANENEFGN